MYSVEIAVVGPVGLGVVGPVWSLGSAAVGPTGWVLVSPVESAVFGPVGLVMVWIVGSEVFGLVCLVVFEFADSFEPPMIWLDRTGVVGTIGGLTTLQIGSQAVQPDVRWRGQTVAWRHCA